MKIRGKLAAMWTSEGDPDVGPEEVREGINPCAGIRIDFEDEEEFAEWVRDAGFRSLVEVTCHES